ncbi:MAG: MFS transporter [Ilumatobacteraceae bacterium]
MASQQQHRRSIIGTGAVLIALSGPGQTAGFSVFVDPLTEHLDVSRGQLTFAYLVGTLAASTTGTWLGRMIDRRGVAPVLPWVALALCLATMLASVSTNLVMLTVAIYGLRSFGQTGMPLSASVFVAKNILQRRGAALGLLTALGGSTISLTPFIAARLIPSLGWKTTWVVEGVFVLMMGLVMSVVIRRLRLEHPHVDDEAADSASAETPIPRNLRRNGFLVVTFGYATTGFVSTALAFHQIAVLGERGLSPAAAASNFLPQSISAAVVALTIGRLVDRVPSRIVVPFAMSVMSVAVMSLTFVGSRLGAIGFAVALGSAAASMAASEGALLARWIGRETLGTWRGRMTSVMVVSTAVAPFTFSVLADWVGSYSSAARLMVLLPIAAGVIAVCTPLPADENRIKKQGA